MEQFIGIPKRHRTWAFYWMNPDTINEDSLQLAEKLENKA
jgi:hypothetical protein